MRQVIFGGACSPDLSRPPRGLTTFWGCPSAMPRVVITGGPGAGKTSLIRELASRGYATADESARSVIAERLARGESARPDLKAFAEETLRRDQVTYEQAGWSSSWVFFDRSVVEAIGFLHEVAPMSAGSLNQLLSRYPVYQVVFVLPPWEAIYATDSERDQTYDEAVSVHAKVVRWYGACGYQLREVPVGSVSERASHVLRVLGARGA